MQADRVRLLVQEDSELSAIEAHLVSTSAPGQTTGRDDPGCIASSRYQRRGFVICGSPLVISEELHVMLLASWSNSPVQPVRHGINIACFTYPC